jgi:staphylococcal nuclease domain-containing protein 1
MASKSVASDEPGAFDAREYLRELTVGKQVTFVTRKQQPDRAYGMVFLEPSTGNGELSAASLLNLGVEATRQGHATPKAIKFNNNNSNNTDHPDPAAASTNSSPEEEYEKQLLEAYKEAQDGKRGIHGPSPTVRQLKNAGEHFTPLSMVEACQKLASQKRVMCIVEYIFDGSRMRCQMVDDQLPDSLLYGTFTLLLAGIGCPRLGNPAADPPIPTEQFAVQAKQFVTTRLLQRKLPISLIGTDKNGTSIVGTVHHPAGNIALELLKNGLARMVDWSVRLMPVGEVPALRVAENAAKRAAVNIWHSYAPPVLASASQLRGTIVEVVSGDTLYLLPDGKPANDASLFKFSLASIRSPRLGSSQAARADEPYAHECKNKLRDLTIGKQVSVDIHYERDIPVRPGETEKRAFGTVAVGKTPDVSEVLISEGLAQTQTHRDDDEKSPRYDELRAAETAAKEAKKGMHNTGAEYKKPLVNDLTDQRKAKAYAGALTRAGKIKAVVEFIFNGALFKLYVPSENCDIRFSVANVRCPQPSPTPGSKQPGKPAEPFGDEARFHAKFNVLQRTVEIQCNGVTNSGIITGSMTILYPQRRDYTMELIGAGFATVDQRKIDYGEAPRALVEAQDTAKSNKVGLWSLVSETRAVEGVKADQQYGEVYVQGRLSEIRSGGHFFYHVANDNESLKVIDESMKEFTKANGIGGAPCDVKLGKVVAALFDDGTGKRWYRARIVERKGQGKVSVLFVDYGNVATVLTAEHLRPLDMTLGTDRIPAIAKEAVLALVTTRSLDHDEGIDAARLLQKLCWGKELVIRTLAPDENGKMTVTIGLDGGKRDDSATFNAKLVEEGIARCAKQSSADILHMKLVDPDVIPELHQALQMAEQVARKARVGMWRYGDVGDEDPDDV